MVLIYLPEGSADVSQVVIRHDTALPAPTGLLAEAGDRFVVLPYGALRDPSLPNSFYTNGHFGPEGLLGLIGALQPYPDGPYGALYGTFQGAAGAFEIGDGGSWSTEISDQGLEFRLLLNADAASQAGMVGKFVVNVVRVPDPGVSGIPDGQDALDGGSVEPGDSADGSAAPRILRSVSESHAAADHDPLPARRGRPGAAAGLRRTGPVGEEAARPAGSRRDARHGLGRPR